jgi:hypothetical protein
MGVSPSLQSGGRAMRGFAALRATLHFAPALWAATPIPHAESLQAAKGSARTIDIDIIAIAQQIIHTDILTVPHPYMHLRRFVLAPLPIYARSGYILRFKKIYKPYIMSVPIAWQYINIPPQTKL